jgi:hypothetical protein
MASLQSHLDEFKHAFESGASPYDVPREAIETMHRATAELKATGIENRSLKNRGSRAGIQSLQSRSCPSEFCRLTSPGPGGR